MNKKTSIDRKIKRAERKIKLAEQKNRAAAAALFLRPFQAGSYTGRSLSSRLFFFVILRHELGVVGIDIVFLQVVFVQDDLQEIQGDEADR